MATVLQTDVRQHILDTAQILIGGKGFTAVGLTEILSAASVPKGSFYHYFGSKDAFGEALLESYFERYLKNMDATLSEAKKTGAERLMRYFEEWAESQANCDPQGKCLAVKLAAEVSDLSEAMRGVLLRGTGQIIKRLARALESGAADGSIRVDGETGHVADVLYQTWLGASLMSKITRDAIPLKTALMATRRMFGIV